MKSVVCSLLFLLLAAFAARADVTYYVALGGDGSDPTSGDLTKAYAHPQTAIDAADGTTPTVIKIATGTYTVKTFETDISVISISKSNVTLEAIDSKGVIIDGQQLGDSAIGTKKINRCVTVSSGLTNVKVSGLVFRNGSIAYNGSGTGSNAVIASGTFEDCEFYGYCFRRNYWFQFSGAAVARRCLFTTSNATASNAPSGQYALTVGENAVVADSVIEALVHYPSANQWKHVLISGSAVVTNTVIRNNTNGTPGSGGGLQSVGYGSQEGVVYMNGGTLVDCVVTNNVCFGYGGGVCVANKIATVKDCLIWYNRATAEGNDIYVKSGVTPTITGTTASDLTDDANGNTNFEPDQEFCTSDNVTAGKAPFTVRFRNRTGASATWDFGDGSATATGVTPEHTYASVGTYTVKMTIGSTTTTRTDYIVATGPKMYVSKSGTPTKPYDTPAKAAAHPQDAIDLAPDGAGTEIVVGDGQYLVRDAKDYAVLEVAKGGFTLRAENGNGHVWIDSARACGNGLVRRTLNIGGGFENVVFDGLVFTNGYCAYSCSCGPSVAFVGSGSFTNCTFDFYCFQRNTGLIVGKTAEFDNCGFTSVARAIQSCQNQDYGIDVSGSVAFRACVFRDLDLSQKVNYTLPFVMLKSETASLRSCLFTNFKSGYSGSDKGRGAIYATAGTVENCTIVGNSAFDGYGGGAYLTSTNVVFRNNIVWNNTAKYGADIYATDYAGCSYSAASDLVTGSNGNFTVTSASDPGFTDAANGDYSLKVKSMLTGRGSVQPWMTDATDLARLPRLFEETVSLGAYEPQGRSVELVGDFAVTGSSFGEPPLTVSFAATVSGGTGVYEYKWDFGDGTPVVYSDEKAPTHVYSSVGAYSVGLTVKCGKVETSFGVKTNIVSAVGEICYVRPDQAGVTPFDTWEKGTSNIVAAVALQPKTVLATNGLYVIDQTESNVGVELLHPIRVVSVEGPTKTILRGNWPDGTSRKSLCKQIVTLKCEGASVEGFSLERGFPPTVRATAGLLANCIVTNQCIGENTDLNIFSGSAVVSNCVFDATGARDGHVNAQMRSIAASGNVKVYGCEVKNLSVTGDRWGSYDRAGISACDNVTVRNCYVHDLRWGLLPASAYASAGIQAWGNAEVDNCTVTRCWAKAQSKGALVASGTAKIRNDLVWGNTYGTSETALDVSSIGSDVLFVNNLVGSGALPSQADKCLFGVDPLFVTNGPSYRIQRNSPCLDGGRWLDWCYGHGMALDFEGQERVRRQPDIGCWEMPNKTGMVILFR